LEKLAPFLQHLAGSPKICLSASYILAECLNAYGINARVRRVIFYFGNEKAVKIYKQEGKKGLIQKMTHDPTIITGLMGKVDGKPWDETFHSVVYLPHDGSIIDLTANSINVPEYDISLKPYWETKDNLPETILEFQFVDEVPLPRKLGVLFERDDICDTFNYILSDIAIKLGLKREIHINFDIKKDGTPFFKTFLRTIELKPEEKARVLLSEIFLTKVRFSGTDFPQVESAINLFCKSRNIKLPSKNVIKQFIRDNFIIKKEDGDQIVQMRGKYFNKVLSSQFSSLEESFTLLSSIPEIDLDALLDQNLELNPCYNNKAEKMWDAAEQLLFVEGDMVNGLLLAQRGLELCVKQARGWWILGTYYMTYLKEFERAILLFRIAITLEPYETRGWMLLADVYRQQELYKEAIVGFEAALNIDAFLIPARHSLTLLYQKTKMKRKAKQNLQKLIALLSDSSNQEQMERITKWDVNFEEIFEQTWLKLGILQYQDRELNQAAASLENVLSYNPRSAKAYYYLGRISLMQDLWNSAEGHFTRNIQLDPSNINSLFYLGKIKWLQKNYSEAKEILKEIEELKPEKWKLKEEFEKLLLKLEKSLSTSDRAREKC
jgi:tetratricopeptide (TPR) repeat protein